MTSLSCYVGGYLKWCLKCFEKIAMLKVVEGALHLTRKANPIND